MKIPKIRTWRRRTPANVNGVPFDATRMPVEGRPLAAVIASAFSRAGIAMRAHVLRRLLAAVGPLALTVVGGGAFAKYLWQARGSEVPVSLDDAAQATSAQIYDLVRYVEQSDPNVVTQVLAALARDPVAAAAVGASVAAVMIGKMARRSRTRQGG